MSGWHRSAGSRIPLRSAFFSPLSTPIRRSSLLKRFAASIGTYLGFIMHENSPVGIARVRHELCRGCGICTTRCPTGAIQILSGRATVSSDRCRGCMICASTCPQGAIVNAPSKTTMDIVREMDRLRREIEKLSTNVSRIEARRMGGG